MFRFYGLSPFDYSATYYCLYFLASETNLSEDDIIRIHDNHGNTIELLGSGGQYLSASSVRSGRYPNPVTNIPRLRKMNVNEDDIFLCAYLKQVWCSESNKELKFYLNILMTMLKKIEQLYDTGHTATLIIAASFVGFYYHKRNTLDLGN